MKQPSELLQEHSVHKENIVTPTNVNAKDIEARLVRVNGLVQGVGFRPTVWRIAAALNLRGEVFNDPQGVGVRLEGDPQALDAFPAALRRECPPLARIDTLEIFPAETVGFTDFRIVKSETAGEVSTMITPDASVCRACLTEVFTPANRRSRYAFTNCTHCGPRFTITRALPYDRPQTSMAVFPMCPACLKEYENPADRRFHAQPNACPVCGPELSWTDARGHLIPEAGDPVRAAAAAIARGEIVAVKGIGGFHLVCDARNPLAVERLRARKGRGEKPLAVMAANTQSIREFVHVSAAEEKMLLSPAHPIVLLERIESDEDPTKPRLELPGIADGVSELGVMLPYTPLHALLFHALEGEPAEADWFEKRLCPSLLVMTSANPGGEPLVIDNDEAVLRLGQIADKFLMHNREILIRCDDSVVRFVNDLPLWVRRGRGVTPEAVQIQAVPAAQGCRAPHAVLAAGSFLKNAAALTRGSELFLTQHIGDLENVASCQALELAAEHLEKILDEAPDAYACDLHPDFFSAQLAQKLAHEHQKPLVAIAHHAAHVGAVMAEAGRSTRTIGAALDGVGLGPDGSVWGGELLACSAEGFERLGTLEALPLPGGDRAARECWRMGAALLLSIDREDLIEPLLSGPEVSPWMLAALPRLAASPNTPRTSALGRWFDAAAALLGLCRIQKDEATAAMRLESAAAPILRHVPETQILAGFDPTWTIEQGVLSLAPFWKNFAAFLAHPEGRTKRRQAQAAAAFELVLSRALVDWIDAATLHDPDRADVMLSGGCFLNRTLASAVPAGLQALGIAAHLPHVVPPGDGGLALGQAWLASLALAEGRAEYPYIQDKTLFNHSRDPGCSESATSTAAPTRV